MSGGSFKAGLAGYNVLLVFGLHFGLVFSSDYDIFGAELELQKFYFACCLYIGTIVGAATGGVLVTHYGNRISIGFSVVFLFLSGVLYVVPPSSKIIYIAARILVGCSGGIALVAQIIYLGEISSPRRRGRYIVYISTAISLGALIEFILFSIIYSDEINLTTGIVTIIFSAIAGLSLKMMKESPYFLICKGNDEQAKENVALLNNYGNNSSEALIEFNEIKKCIYEECEMSLTPMEDLFRNNKKSFFVSSLFQIIHSSSCHMAIIGQNLRFHTFLVLSLDAWDKMFFIYLITGTARFIGTLFAAMFVDQLGQRKLLAISGLIGAICIFVLSMMGFLEGSIVIVGEVESKYYILVAVAVIGDIISGFGFGSVHNIILGESLTKPSKALGVAAAIIIQGISGLMFDVISGVYIEDGYTELFLPRGIIAALFLITGFFVSIKVLPQTQQKTHGEVIALYKSI